MLISVYMALSWQRAADVGHRPHLSHILLLHTQCLGRHQIILLVTEAHVRKQLAHSHYLNSWELNI